jgi:hypothetical protein
LLRKRWKNKRIEKSIHLGFFFFFFFLVFKLINLPEVRHSQFT